MFDCLQSHGLHHTSPCPSPSPSPWVCPSSLPLNQWCHQTISSSVTLFSFGLRSFLATSSFPVNWLFVSSGWFSFSISPSNDYSRLISFRIDWFDLFDVQGTLKSLLQHHSWKTSILPPSVFFMVQLLQLYLTNGKTIVLTIQTFVSNVMSWLFNTLTRFVIAFWPRSSNLLI